MFKRDHIALAAALLEVRPFITEVQYHRMKRNNGSPGFYLILQWESCVNAVCRAASRDSDVFDADGFLIAAGFISLPKQRKH